MRPKGLHVDLIVGNAAERAEQQTVAIGQHLWESLFVIFWSWLRHADGLTPGGRDPPDAGRRSGVVENRLIRGPVHARAVDAVAQREGRPP